MMRSSALGPMSALMLAILTVAGSGHAAGGAFPRENATDVPDGVAEPFAGRWAIGFPEGAGMINTGPVIGCDDPVELEAVGEARIIRHSPGGESAAFDLSAFSGRTSLIRNSEKAFWRSGPRRMPSSPIRSMPCGEVRAGTIRGYIAAATDDAGAARPAPLRLS